MAESKWNAIQWVKRVLGTGESWTVDGVFFDTRGWRLLTASPKLMTWSDAQDGRLLLQQDRASDAMPYLLRAQELVEKQKGGERCFLLRETAGGSPPALLAKMRIVP